MNTATKPRSLFVLEELDISKKGGGVTPPNLTACLINTRVAEELVHGELVSLYDEIVGMVVSVGTPASLCSATKTPVVIIEPAPYYTKRTGKELPK